MGFFYVSSRYGDERRFQNKTKNIRKISVGNFRSERSQVPFFHRPFSITMDTSKRTYELPMTFPDRVVGLIYSLSNHKSSLTNLVEKNAKNRKPQQLGTHYFTPPFIFCPAFLWLIAKSTGNNDCLQNIRFEIRDFRDECRIFPINTTRQNVDHGKLCGL